MKSNQSLYTKTRKRNKTLVTESVPNDSINLYPLLKNVYELSHDAIVVYDLTARLILDVNSKFTDTFYFTKEEVLNTPSMLLNLFIDESEFFNICETLEEIDVIKDYKIVLKNKDNENLNILLSAQIQKIKDNTYVVCVLRDVSCKKNVETVLRTHQEQFSKEVGEQTEKFKISEQLLEEKIKADEELFKQVVKNAVSAVSITTLEGKILFANNVFAKFFGYGSSSAIIPERIFSTKSSKFGWKDASKRDTMLKILKQKGEVSNYNIDVLDKNGETKHIIYSAKLTNNLIYAMFLDITKERQAELLIKNNERRYRDLYDNALVALLTTDVNEGIPIETNLATVKMFGYNSVSEFQKKFINKNHFIEPNRDALIKRLKRHAHIDNLHLLCVNNKDEKIWVDAELKLDKERGLIHWVLLDVSDRINQRTQNRRLLKAIEESPEGVYITDSRGAIEYVNKQFCEITGYSEEELVGNNPRTLKSGYHTDEFYAELWKTISSGNIWKGEMYNKKKNGDYYWEYMSIAPIFEEGKITHYVAIKEDITAKKQMISDLLEAKAKAEENDKLKTAFLTNISHEIRTPMNGILGFAGLLKENNLSGEEQKEYIHLIEESGERMLNTIQDIIEMSRIESGEINFNLSQINITDQLKHVYNTFYDEASKKGIELIHKNLPQKDLIIESDKAKLSLIFNSLIKNAIAYTNIGHVVFGYTIDCVNHHKYFKFYVKDTGIGIPGDKHKAIFERFVQADNRINRTYEGSGLGLSISKAYVEMLEGEIWVESDVGKGSVFYVSIPLENSNKNINELEVVYATIKKENKWNDLKILIVDDEELVRKYLGILLKGIKKDILYAETGKEAVRLYKENPDIDLILMDVRMPEMNGIEATKHIRKLNKDVQIIIQSAFVEVGQDYEALDAGANYFLTKPIKKNKLFNLMEKVSQSKKIENEITQTK